MMMPETDIITPIRWRIPEIRTLIMVKAETVVRAKANIVPAVVTVIIMADLEEIIIVLTVTGTVGHVMIQNLTTAATIPRRTRRNLIGSAGR
jgi:hypothetical protein